MATTQLADVFVPEVYASYTAVNGPEKTAFFESGVAVRNPALGNLFGNGGRVAELPFWKDLDASDEPNYGTDNPADVAVPAKVTTGVQIARLASLNQGYSSADLTAELAGQDPMQQVRNRFGTYWMRQWQRRVIASLQGVLADNVANDSGDMRNNIAAATNAGVAAGTLFSRAAFTTAAFTSGDHYDDYVAIAVHSVVYKRMVDNDDIEFIPDSQGTMTATFMGRRVIVDDGLPFTAAAGSGGTDAAATYTSFLFGAGLIGYDESTPKTPVELEREASQGNGAGVETLWERKSWVIHPLGTAFTSTTLTNGNATLAQLRLAGNWNRVVERKNIPFAALVTNG
ncbi:MAG: phage coat protein [Marinobacter sp.]|nr:phage coat protein [Marinobacter sp.]|tara:strand:- start:2519 stop:3544 length:1026 start_codon:yes stop_codon:yes gene_type:complete